jgi:methionine-rich copper-binding protein CopC
LATFGVLTVLTLLLVSSQVALADIDTTKPFVTHFSPADGQGGVNIDTVISIEFSEDVRDANLDSYIVLKDGDNIMIPKRVDYSNLTYRVILTPLEPLRYSMTYFMTVSTGIRDIAGNPLLEPVSWYFETAREKIPPQVLSTTPLNNADDVSINATITVHFSEEMDTDSVRTGLVVHDSLENPVIGNTTPSIDGLSITFKPLFSFGYGEPYTVTVLKTVKDLAGNTMATDHVFGFRVQLEQIPPRVVNLEPIDQSQFVSKDTRILVTYSEPMNSTSLAGSVVIVDNLLEEVSTTPQYNADNYTLIIRPDQALEYQTIYMVTVSTTAQDIAGNHLDKEYYTTFTTEPLPQQSPRIVRRTPPEDRFNWYEGIAATFEVEADDPNGDILVYTWFVNGEEKEGETFNEFNFYPEPGSMGSYKVEVEVYDGVTAPVTHYWIIDVLATGPGDNNGIDNPTINWWYIILIVIIVVLVSLFSIGYLFLMDRRQQILARTRKRLRPLSFKRTVAAPKPPSYEEMYLRADGTYARKSPEFKPVAPPGGAMAKTKASEEAAVDGTVMGEAPQLLEAKEVEIRKATVGPYATDAPELKKKRIPGALVCPKCGGKAIEAAHGRVWCDECGFIE